MSQPAAQEKDAPSADHSSEKAASPDVPNLTHGQETNVLEVVNADYALALSTGPQLSPTSWASIELFGILLVAYMGSLSNGFDGSGMFPNFQGDQTLNVPIISDERSERDAVRPAYHLYQ